MTSRGQQTVDAATGVARWEIDAIHSNVEFSVRHMMISTVRGRFAEVNGHIDFDPADPTSAKIEVEIPVASIDTRSEGRDEHLRSDDFFAADKYPNMTFTSSRVEAAGGNRYRVTGDLTIRGVTREVVLDVEFHGTHPDAYGGVRAGFSATTSINRFDYGLTWNAAIESGGVVVGDTVKINLEIQAVRQA